MKDATVDLRSDTVTRPTAAMRAAMAEAEVGDDVLDGDPTTRRLEERVAALLGKERGLFVPSGVMGNQLALGVLGRPGTEVITEAGGHIIHSEETAVASLWGMQVRPVQTTDGRLTPELFSDALRGASRFVPEASVVVFENTHVDSGGSAWTGAEIEATAAVARESGLGVHLDGARLWNAWAAGAGALADLAAPADTVTVSMSKGLGAPVGSVLCGPAHLMDRAWRLRRRLGGGMRQSGILAAAALYALDNHLTELVADHNAAAQLAEGIAPLPGLKIHPPATNVLLVELAGGAPTAPEALDLLSDRGILMTEFGRGRIRAVTHRDVSPGGISLAIAAFHAVFPHGT